MDIFSQSKWIWRSDIPQRNSYVRFYGTLEGEGDADFYISVDSNYALYIGGEMIETGQYADYPFRKVYDKITLKALRPNTDFYIDAYNQGDDSSTLRGEKAGLIFAAVREGKIIAASGECTPSAPLSTYKQGAGVPHVTGQLGYSFLFDSRAELPSPTRSTVVEKQPPVQERPIKKLVTGADKPAFLTIRGAFDEYKDENISKRVQYSSLAFREPNVAAALPNEKGIALDYGEQHDGVYCIIDVGEESAGILSLDVELPSDAEILAAWGEHLEDGRVRAYVGTRVFTCSYYGKAGRNRFVAPFRRLGMRYLELHIYAPSARLFYAGIKPTDYPLTFYPFHCADSLHNKIYDASLRTLQMCMHEHYEDCPWREQSLYSMDSRNQMLIGYYAFHEYTFARESLRLMAEAIRDDGLLELCSPARVGITIPSFTAIFLTQVYEYMLFSGDYDFVRSVMPTLIKIADAFIERIDPAVGLIPCYREAQYWNFYEWQDGLAGSISGSIPDEEVTFDAPLNAFVAFGLNSLQDMINQTDFLEDSGEREKYYAASDSLIKAINKRFWNPERGVYASYLNKKGEIYHYCELTNSLILYSMGYGMYFTSRCDRVKQALAAGTLIPVTLSHSIFKYDVLLGYSSYASSKPLMFRQPNIDICGKYARYVFSDIAEKWGKMLYSNATTFWETIEGAAAFGNAGSLCHGWSAIPAYFYHRYAANLPGEVTGLYECTTDK